MKGRVIFPQAGEKERDPYSNLALEEALFLRNEGLTLRIWENGESVIIGRAQLARFETDVEYCKRNGIPIVRRFTSLKVRASKIWAKVSWPLVTTA